MRIEGNYHMHQEAIIMKWITDSHERRLAARDSAGTWRIDPFAFEELNIDASAEEWLAAIL